MRSEYDDEEGDGRMAMRAAGMTFMDYNDASGSGVFEFPADDGGYGARALVTRQSIGEWQ